MFDGLLSITVFMPAAVAVLVALFARGEKADQQIRWIAIGATVVTFVLTVLIFVGYDRSEGGVQMVDIDVEGELQGDVGAVVLTQAVERDAEVCVGCGVGRVQARRRLELVAATHIIVLIHGDHTQAVVVTCLALLRRQSLRGLGATTCNDGQQSQNLDAIFHRFYIPNCCCTAWVSLWFVWVLRLVYRHFLFERE